MHPDSLHAIGTAADTDAHLLSRVKGIHILTLQMNVVGMESGSWSPKPENSTNKTKLPISLSKVSITLIP